MFALFFASDEYDGRGASKDFLFSLKLDVPMQWMNAARAMELLLKHEPHEYDCHDIIDVLLVGEYGECTRCHYEWDTDYDSGMIERKLILREINGEPV